MKYVVEVAHRVLEVEVREGEVRLAGRAVEARLVAGLGAEGRRLVRGRRSRPLLAEPGEEPGEWRVSAGGHRLAVTVADPRARATRRAAGGRPDTGAVRAPMPGKVVRVLVREGERVEFGRALVVVEAMKMENELRAPAAGTVRRVGVEPGAAVEKGTLLVELEPEA